MSFLATLQSLGLAPGGQPQQAPAPQQPGVTSQSNTPAPSNPYGLNPDMMKLARLQTLSNFGNTLMAMSQQMTPAQRSRMMQTADWSGGAMGNIQGAMELQDGMQERALNQQKIAREGDARVMLNGMIQRLPQGRLRDAVTFFYTSGDLAKAHELLTKRERVYDSQTGRTIVVDALGEPVEDGPGGYGGVTAVPTSGAAPVTGPTPVTGGAPVTGPAPVTGEAPVTGGGEVDATTAYWRKMTNDPLLTPAEVTRLQTAPSMKDRNDIYQKILDDRQSSLTSNRTAAEQLTSKFAEQTKSYDTIIGAGERAVQVATMPNMNPAAKLTTLYQYMKALDPDGAVREGDVRMAEQMQALKDQWMQWAESQFAGGGPISEVMINDMAREMARLADDAIRRKASKRQQMVEMATSRQVPTEMVSPRGSGSYQNIWSDDSQNMQRSIGFRLPAAPTGQRSAGGRTNRRDRTFTPRLQRVEE